MNPVIIYEDNKGAIFQAKNQQVSIMTKHIDATSHFIRDCILRIIGSLGEKLLLQQRIVT